MVTFLSLINITSLKALFVIHLKLTISHPFNNYFSFLNLYNLPETILVGLWHTFEFILTYILTYLPVSFPGSLMVKNPPASARDVGDSSFILGLGRCPGGGNGYPLQYSCLENPMDRGAWWAAVHRVTENWMQLSQCSQTQLTSMSSSVLHFLNISLDNYLSESKCS